MMDILTTSKFERSDFVALISPSSNGRTGEHVEEIFARETSLLPRVTYSTPSSRVDLYFNSGIRIFRNQPSGLIILLHGEFYDGPRLSLDDEGKALLEGYEREGHSYFARLDGSYALFIVDPRRDQVVVVTDRLASRTVFRTVSTAGDWVSTDLAVFRGRGCDLSAAIPFIISGFICQGRTSVQGVRKLEKASAHIVSARGWSVHSYWSYQFTQEYTGRSFADLREELAAHLRASVSVRLKSGERILCSLSGGYDSRAVLGLLSERTERERILCVSYGPAEADDVKVPKELAARFGFRHRTGNFAGRLAQSLSWNAHLGSGIVDFMPSADTLVQFAPDFSRSGSVLFVGDECFGWDEVPPLDDERAIMAHIVGVRNPLVWPDGIFAAGVAVQGLVREIEGDWAELAAMRARFTTIQEFKDYLYFDQRLPNLQLPWRELYFGRYLPVRNPLLGRDILDFIRRLPDAARHNRSLYCDCIREMFPDLFGIEIARFNGNPMNHEELVASSTKELEELLECPSRLDAFIPPDNIRKLTHGIAANWRERGGGAGAGQARGTHRSIARAIHRVRDALRRPSRSSVSVGTFRPGARHLERILVLREFFSQRAVGTAP